MRLGNVGKDMVKFCTSIKDSLLSSPVIGLEPSKLYASTSTEYQRYFLDELEEETE